MYTRRAAAIGSSPGRGAIRSRLAEAGHGRVRLQSAALVLKERFPFPLIASKTRTIILLKAQVCGLHLRESAMIRPSRLE